MRREEGTIDRLVAEGMRDAGRALLLQGPGAGAAVASDALRRAVGGIDAWVWFPEGAPGDMVDGREGETREGVLQRFVHSAAVERVFEGWSGQGRDAVPVVLALTQEDEEGGLLREAGADSVLLVPLAGSRRTLGALLVSLPAGTTLDDERMEAAALLGELTGIGLDVVVRGQAARETDARLRRFMQQLPDPAMLLDDGGVVRDVSETISDIARTTASGVVGRALDELVLEEDRRSFHRSLREAFEAGSSRGTVGVAGRRKKERREIELNMRRFSERRVLAVARDVTQRVHREHNLRVLLDWTPQVMTAGSQSELWSRLSRAVQALLPRATYVWVYRAEEEGLKVEWTNRPGAPRWHFNLRGWGPNIAGLLRQEDGGGEFLRRYGPDREMARRQLAALSAGQGFPLLLDRPAEQLGVFLSERELAGILEFWGDAVPGQLIHCPVMVDRQLDFLVVVDASPGERPFDHEDATFVWQLANLAHQALGRIEGFQLARRQLAELETFREAVRQVGEVRGGQELVGALLQRAMWAVEADRAVLFVAEKGGWRRTLGVGEGEGVRQGLCQLPPLPESEEGVKEPLYLVDAAKDRAWSDIAGEGVASLAGVPLVATGRTVGVLVLGHPMPRRYDDGDRQMAEFFADELALVVAQERLSRQAERASADLGGVMESVDWGLVLADGEGRVARANRAAIGLLQGGAPPVTGQSLLELFPTGAREQVAQQLASALGGESFLPSVLQLGARIVDLRVVPTAGGGVLLVLAESGPSGPPGDVPAKASSNGVGEEDLERVTVAWEQAETAAGQVADLLTALLARLEMQGEGGGGEEVERLAEAVREAGEELRRYLGTAHPSRGSEPVGDE